MAELDKLCYSPNGGNLAYHGTDDNLIYKGAVTPPTPPTEYGDVILIVTLSPQFLEGTKLHDYQQYNPDWRLSIWQPQYSPTKIHIATMTETIEIPKIPGVSTSTGGVVRPLGETFDFPQMATFTVYATACQPSSGATFSSQVEGYMWEWYDEYWNYHDRSVNDFTCTFSGNEQGLLTGMTMTIS